MSSIDFFLDFPIEKSFTNFGDENKKYLVKLRLTYLTSMGPEIRSVKATAKSYFKSKCKKTNKKKKNEILHI